MSPTKLTSSLQPSTTIYGILYNTINLYLSNGNQKTLVGEEDSASSTKTQIREEPYKVSNHNINNGYLWVGGARW